MSSETHRIRLRNGIRVTNLLTGDTEPTYGEYVLAEDYDACERDLRDAVKAIHEWDEAKGVLAHSVGAAIGIGRRRVAEAEERLRALLARLKEGGI